MKNRIDTGQAVKRCPRCEQRLPLDSFWRNRSRADGLNTYCKECASRIVREWTMRHPAKAAGFARKANKKRSAKKAEAKERYEAEYPGRHAANLAVTKAIRRGDLPKAETLNCAYDYEFCRGQAREWHHESYDDPLKVVAVCSSCHRQWHRDHPDFT